MNKTLWLAFGFIGQGLFAARFIVQWIKSEKEKKSVVPIHFWYFSFVGGAMLFIYVCHLRDPVLILGQLSGLFIYARNLQLIYKEKKALKHTKGLP